MTKQSYIRLAFTALLFCIAINLPAQMLSSGDVTLYVTTAPEVKLEGGYSIKMPVFQGDSMLTSGNNLRIDSLLGVSPIAASLSVNAVLTPIAFMELNVGGGVGTGWDFPLLEMEGLRVDTGSTLVSDSLGGAYYMGKAGAALQFSSSAIFPQARFSILGRTYHEIKSEAYSNASDSGQWEFELGGLHKNGYTYKGEYFVGHQLPFLLNLIGVQLETYIYDVFTDDPSDMLIDLSAVTNLSFTDALSLMIVPQFTTKNVNETTRVISKGDLHFNRVAAVLTYSL